MPDITTIQGTLQKNTSMSIGGETSYYVLDIGPGGPVEIANLARGAAEQWVGRVVTLQGYWQQIGVENHRDAFHFTKWN